MTSTVDIINIALDLLGEDPITDPNQKEPSARRADRNYPLIRDAVLRDHPWNCAQARAELASSDPDPVWGPAAAYDLPVDCLKVRRAGPDGTTWRVEGRRIVADAGAPLRILYTRRITDPNQFDALLVQAIGARLAVQIAPAITQDRGRLADVKGLSDDSLAAARSVDGQESGGDTLAANQWLNARIAGIGNPYGDDGPGWG